MNLESRLRNSILTFANIGMKSTYFQASENHLFEINNNVVLIKNILSFYSSYFNWNENHSIDGVLIGISHLNCVVGEVEVGLTSNLHMLSKITYYISPNETHGCGMRGVVAWIKKHLKSKENAEKFINWFEMLNISLI